MPVVILLFAAILAVFLWMAWVLVRQSSRRDAGFTGLAVFAMLLAAIQFATGYSFANVLAPMIVYGIACVAYAVVVIAAWRKNRLMSVVGAGIGVIGLILAAPNILVLGMGTTNIFPAAEGRLTPTTTYRLFLRHSLWGATPYYGYIVYSNPRRFPLIEKEVAQGASPCQSDTQLSDTVVSRGRDDQIVRITCRGAPAGAQPVEIVVR
jgi:hypothetical protein